MAEKRKAGVETESTAPRRSMRLKSRADSNVDLLGRSAAEAREVKRKKTAPAKKRVEFDAVDVAASSHLQPVRQKNSVKPMHQGPTGNTSSKHSGVISGVRKPSVHPVTSDKAPAGPQAAQASIAAKAPAQTGTSAGPKKVAKSTQTQPLGHTTHARMSATSPSKLRAQVVTSTTIPTDLAARLNAATGTLLAEAERRYSDGRPPRFRPPVWEEAPLNAHSGAIRDRSQRDPSLQISPRSTTTAKDLAQKIALRRQAMQVVPQQRLADMARLFTQSRAWAEAKTPAVEVIPDVILQDLIARCQPTDWSDTVNSARPSIRPSPAAVAPGWKKWLDDEREKLLAEDDVVTSSRITGQPASPLVKHHQPTVTSEDEHDDTTISISEIEAAL